MGIFQRVANKDAVLISLEDGLSLQQYATDSVDGGGYYVTGKLADVLVTLGAVVVTLILVESEVELGTVLNHRTVERRQEHVVLVVKLRYGNNEQTMILTCVAVYQRRCTVGTRTVCSKQFTTERLLKIGHHSFLES